MIESVGYYYDKIQVPVTIHFADGQPDAQSTAYVYQMRDEHVQKDLDSGYKHNNDHYVGQCAASDLAHFELRGLPDPDTISVPVYRAGDL